MRGVGWGIALLVVAAGCPKRAEEVVDPIAPLLADADAAWEARGENGFDPVAAALDRAFATQPDNPNVLWRLVRLNIGLGLAAEEEQAALDAYATARAIGVQCLGAGAALQRQLPNADEAPVLPRITAAEEPCVAWTALAWARWIAGFGARAAAVDVPAVQLLIDRAEPTDVEGVARWARGILLATMPPEDGGDPDAATQLLLGIAEGSSWELPIRADVVFLIAEPGRDGELLGEQVRLIRQATPTTPEGRRAAERATAIGRPVRSREPGR